MIHKVEYRSKLNHHYDDWTELDYYIRFKSLRMTAFDVRINGEVFRNYNNSSFEKKFNDAMVWIKLIQND